MAKHEKHLLILIAALLLAAITWVMIGSFATGHSPIFLMTSFYHSLTWIGPVVFLLIGLAGFYYEMTIISEGLRLFELDNEPIPITDKYAVDIGIGLYIGFVFLGFVYGVDEAGILEGMHNMLIACLGFSISISLMLLGAIVARIKRNHF